MGEFPTWKFLHIVTMFFAVALALSGEIVMRRVAGSRDPRTIQVAGARVRPLGNLASVFLLAGIAFGVVAALTAQIDLLAPWLISAYALIVVAIAIGVTITDPWVARLEKAAADSGGDTPSAELIGVIEDRRALVATGALMVIIAALVFVMVMKPFS